MKKLHCYRVCHNNLFGYLFARSAYNNLLLHWEECTEARFFSEDKELHFFDVDGKKQAVAVSDEDGKDELVKEYEIAGKFGSIGSSVFVKEYIGYDEDGQANVVLTRLQGIK